MSRPFLVLGVVALCACVRVVEPVSPMTARRVAAAPSSLSGTYPTRVSLTSNTCGPVTVQDNPTAVFHDAASRSVTITHAGTSYSGTLRSDSGFATAPKGVDAGDGYRYAIALSGRFHAEGFDADATVDRIGATGACRYTVHWTAKRETAPR